MINSFINLKHSIKNWFIKNADSKNAKWWLGVISFTESSFFPIPTDPFLMAVLMVKSNKWLKYSLFVSAFSVLGGVFGYLVGFLFFELIGQPIINVYHLQSEFEYASELFNNNVFWTTFIAAFTPIPYKIFTIVAGLTKSNFIIFLIASILGRTIRFLIIGYIMKVFGERIGKLVFKYFNILLILIVALILLYILFKIVI